MDRIHLCISTSLRQCRQCYGLWSVKTRRKLQCHSTHPSDVLAALTAVRYRSALLIDGRIELPKIYHTAKAKRKSHLRLNHHCIEKVPAQSQDGRGNPHGSMWMICAIIEAPLHSFHLLHNRSSHDSPFAPPLDRPPHLYAIGLRLSQYARDALLPLRDQRRTQPPRVIASDCRCHSILSLNMVSCRDWRQACDQVLTLECSECKR